MCNYRHSYDPARCIIPPYISNKLAGSPDKKIAARAIKNAVETVKLRAKREFSGGLSDAQRALLQPTKPKSKTAKLNMQVYDMLHGTNPSAAKLVWDNGTLKGKSDKQVNNVIAAGTATWDFYYKLFGRNSVDNRGLLLRHFVHYSSKYNNAMWDGSEMVYGDGDGVIFGDFTADPDIIGHELTHGVTQYESNLAYHNQSGALNESLSDVFGIMVKQRMLNQDVKTANWLIGENVVRGSKYALRSMKAPGTAYVNHPQLGTDPQPASFDKYVKLPDTSSGDYGGVHINSGITNFAFYKAAFDMGGFAWDKAGRVWYAAMTDKTLQQEASFKDFRDLTIKQAGKIFGKNSLEQKAVTAAWKSAKV